ncbi:MAG: response regulator [bacterium]
MHEREFTTFEVGKICNVSHTSVINWVTKKKLKAHFTPGGHRRINLSELLKFLKQHRIEIPTDLIRQPSVLIADDEQQILDMLTAAFSELAPEFKVRTTKNGIEALMMIGREKPDVLILDIIMPEMDGIKVVKELKVSAETRNIKIIVMTGKNLLDSYSNFLIRSTAGVFTKPFSVVELVRHSVECFFRPKP